METQRPETNDLRRSLIAGRILVFVAIAFSALTLRVAVTAFTPLAARISDEVGFSSTVVGVFGMLPTAMFALFGLFTPALGKRFGLERTALLAMLLAGIGMLTRALVSDVWSLLFLSAVALAGMGIGNVVIPPLVKRYFSDRLAVMSSIYITMVQLGTVVPALIAVPVADSHGWRTSLGIWAVVGFVAAVPWIAIIADRRGRDRTDRTGVAPHNAQRKGKTWKTSLGWGMAGMFGMTSLITYSMFTWVPKLLTDAGASSAFAGSMVGVFALVGLISAFAAPTLCARIANPFPIVVGCALCYVVGFLGLLIAPMSAPVLWIVIVGLGPSTFPMSLTLINLRTRSQVGSSALSGFTQGIGYTVACVGPLLFGVLHDTSHGYALPFGLLFVAVGVVLVSSWHACKPRYLEDMWPRS
ncbi:MFS transporter [Antrihabitans cavernicola]|uniref:MFS transporter n=1 Tax=Antrihabitans cavernicola TaxID=2495913 RepID=A0A5A7SGS3_9NOCA|nr:MFS transporter [Spelaeibacter cavernicola]